MVGFCGIVYDCFSRIKILLGRTEKRTRDRIYCQTIRTVGNISRDDRAIIATCSLRKPTDRQTDRLKAHYRIDDIDTDIDIETHDNSHLIPMVLNNVQSTFSLKLPSHWQ